MRPFRLLALAMLLSHCTAIGPQPDGIDHVVLVWLKRPGNANDRAELISAGESLRSIPGIRSFHSGQALRSDRPIVDDSFDVGFVIRFESAHALTDYASHPVHLEAQGKLRALSDKVVIYDIKQDP